MGIISNRYLKKAGGKEVTKIVRSRTREESHIEVIVTTGNNEMFLELRKALIKMRRLHKISYAITVLDSQE